MLMKRLILIMVISVFCIVPALAQAEGTGEACITSCEGLPNGDYQSCNGCTIYATCSNEILYDGRPCAPATPPLVWDDNLKRCDYDSETCSESTFDDSDNDGVSDERDECANSDLSTFVVIDGCGSGVENYSWDTGCTLSDLITNCAADAINHGQFVSCVSGITNGLKKYKMISGVEKGAIQDCAANAQIPAP